MRHGCWFLSLSLSASIAVGCDPAGPEESQGEPRAASFPLALEASPDAARATEAASTGTYAPPTWGPGGLTREEVAAAQRRDRLARQLDGTESRSSVIVIARVESEGVIVSHYPGHTETEEMRLLVLSPEDFLRGTAASLEVVDPRTRRHRAPGTRALFFLSDFEGAHFNEGGTDVTAAGWIPEFELSVADLRGRL